MDRSAVSTEERPVPRLVLVSSRPLIGVLFQEVVERQGLDVELVSGSRSPLSRLGEQLSGAGAAIIDVGADPAAAVELCRELHEAHPRLPLVALACCSRSLSPSQLRMLIRAGVRTVLDLDARPEQLLGALETAAEGGSTLQLTLEPAAADFLRELVSSPGPRSATKIALLELVSLGLPERESGAGSTSARTPSSTTSRTCAGSSGWRTGSSSRPGPDGTASTGRGWIPGLSDLQIGRIRPSKTSDTGR